ncbi:probable disease resistance protein At5g66900 [Cornus florida]|uniref:probable disease resistance protein At5g66900 n=1 Tax=Cornus florida TaxID=4283 RepID=UPI0028A246DB|nr:probable disease resistance protein At5g66900 [Cornus florida]
MALELVGGAVLGAVVGELLRAILDVKDQAISFRSRLERLESSVKSIDSIVREIKELDRELVLPVEETKMFTDRLREAVNLVHNCSTTKWWNFIMKFCYMMKLKELDETVEKFCQTLVLLRDSRKNLVKLNEMQSGVYVGPCGAPEVLEFIVGLDVPLQELKTRLLEKGVQVVVLSAPGGYGKSTLAKKLCHDAEIKGIFADNVFFVTVSNTPDLRVIVGKMYQHCKSFPVPEFLSDDDAINQLGILLQSKIGLGSVLVVLDDVWHESDSSESLIEKFKLGLIGIPGYKILVTSRTNITNFVSYKLDLLSDEDAMALFCRLAFLPGRSINMPDNLVDKIVKGCGNHPLALSLVGRSLIGKSEETWKSKVQQLSEGQSIIDSNSRQFISLKTSIDALDKSIKECFLDLGLFPEGQRIPVMALMDMWAELYNLDEDSKYALANIYELASRNLVNLVFTRKGTSELDGYYNDHFVTQHGLLRDLAIHQSSQGPIKHRERLILNIRGDDLSKWSIEQIQRSHARLLSISTDETFSSSWCNMLLPEKTLSSSWCSFSTLLGCLSKLVQPSYIQLPEVEVAILNFRTTNYSLPKFIEKMDQLKVLIITNNGFLPAELSNFELLGHLSHLKRIRLEHVSISFLSESQLPFRNLRKISFDMCKIAETFRNCTIEFAFMFPNLIEIDIHCCSDLVKLPEGFCDIIRLKKLSITKCNDLIALPQNLGMLTNLEVLRLHSCTGLMGLPDSVVSLHKLKFLDISDCLDISDLPERIGELSGLKKLDMRGCCRLHQLQPSVKDLGELRVVICDEDTVDLWEPFKIHLNNLTVSVFKEDKNLNWLPSLHH